LSYVPQTEHFPTEKPAKNAPPHDLGQEGYAHEKDNIVPGDLRFDSFHPTSRNLISQQLNQ
jgi:hypothetical protein